LKASFPCVVARGPVGPCEILHAEAPSLFAVELKTGWQIVAGDAAGFHRLAFLAGLVATRRDTGVYLTARRNADPAWVREDAASPGLLDLVLAPRHLALRPKTWKALRARKATESRRVVLPPLARLTRFPRYPFGHFDRETRGMDRHVGASTLILSGERTAFLGLAAFAAHMATCEANWDGAHLDPIARGGDPTLMLDFWDPRRD